MTTLKIGALSYINAFPFFFPFIHKKIRHSAKFVYSHPTHINELLATGKIDIGLISTAHFLDNRYIYILLSSFGIAASKKVESVRLYFRSSIKKLHQKKVLLTSESETSVELLRVLCYHKWNIEPNFFREELSEKSMKNDVEGFLLIGDSCLKNRDTAGFDSIDLAESWVEYTKKPFTFALFATRCDSWLQHPLKVKEFHNALTKAFLFSQENIATLLKEAKKKTELPISILKSYYKHLDYELEAKHFQGLEHFAQLRRDLPPRCI